MGCVCLSERAPRVETLPIANTVKVTRDLDCRSNVLVQCGADWALGFEALSWLGRSGESTRGQSLDGVSSDTALGVASRNCLCSEGLVIACWSPKFEQVIVSMN